MRENMKSRQIGVWTVPPKTPDVPLDSVSKNQKNLISAKWCTPTFGATFRQEFKKEVHDDIPARTIPLNSVHDNGFLSKQFFTERRLKVREKPPNALMKYPQPCLNPCSKHGKDVETAIKRGLYPLWSVMGGDLRQPRFYSLLRITLYPPSPSFFRFHRADSHASKMLGRALPFAC